MSVSSVVPVIGLVGGIGSGKSTIARACQSLRPLWTVLDADVVGHEVLRTPEVRQQLSTTFGTEIFDNSGEVNRSRLARLVFGPEQFERRQALEAIVHPEIRRRIESQIATMRADGSAEAILLDAPVLLEAGWRAMCDLVVLIDVPREERLRRVVETRGWSEAEFDRRESSQMSLAEKQRLSDLSVHNEGDPHAVAAQLISLCDSRRAS